MVGMTDDEHNRTLAAGQEFYAGLKKLLDKYGLDDTNGPSLVLIALGAVMATTDMTQEQIAGAAEMLKQYWVWDPESKLVGGAKFSIPDSGRMN